MRFFKENRGLLTGTALMLFIITAGAALLLAGIWALTSPGIEETARKKTVEAMETVFPGGTFSSEPVFESGDAAVYGVTLEGGSDGYCVLVEPIGFSSEIFMIVGVDAGGKVTGVEISRMSETVGIGTKVEDAEFLNRFNGLSGSVSIGTGEGKVEAVSGATVSSRAVVRGINQALTAVRDCELGGNAS